MMACCEINKMDRKSCAKLKLKLEIQVFTELRCPVQLMYSENQLIETIIMCWLST